MVITFVEKLILDYEHIEEKVKRGELPLADRIKAIDKAVTEYAVAHAEAYERSDKTFINYKDEYILDRFADLVIREDLKWSHPDKMSIVEYPFTSESQEEERKSRYCLVPDVIFGDRRFNGRRTTSHTDEDGNVTSSKSQITLPTDETYNRAETKLIVRDALANAGLTQKQKEVIYLTFYKRMTQDEIADVLGISRQACGRLIKRGLSELRNYLTEKGFVFGD